MLAQKTLQVTLALNFAALLNFSAVSSMLTNIIILRSFLMFLQISPAWQSSVIEMIISLGKYFLGEFVFVVSAPCLLQREEIIWSNFSEKFYWKRKKNIGSFSLFSSVYPQHFVFHFQPRIYPQTSWAQCLCPCETHLSSFREILCHDPRLYPSLDQPSCNVFLLSES